MEDPATRAKLDAVYQKYEKKTTTAQIKEAAVSGKDPRWGEKFGSNPGARLTRKYRTPSQRPKLQHDGYTGFLPNLEIKLSHKVVTVSHKCCYKCTPTSHTAWKPTIDRALNLAQRHTHRRFGFFHYYFNDACTCSKFEISPLPETCDAVLNSDEVQQQIESYSDKNFAIKRARQLYATMRVACSFPLLTKLAGWILTKILNRSTSGIHVEQKELDILKEALSKSKKIPIVYLPLHRSHLDYLILNWILALHDLPTPFIAAGDNLDIPIVGPIFRRLGAFFIRRKPAKDHELYKAILGQYLVELLKAGCSVEFFIEGRRSRSGLLNSSKVGLLSQIVAAVKEGVIGDVLLCPLSLTYDKVPEESLTLELQGAKKEVESAFSAIWHSLTFPIRQHYGSIHVRFSEPFSLVEYLEKCVGEVRRPQDNWMNSADMDADAVYRLSCRLGDHILHNAMQTSNISPTSLFSLVMLGSDSVLSQVELEKEAGFWGKVLAALKKETKLKMDAGFLDTTIDSFRKCMEVTDGSGACEGSKLVARRYDSKVDLLFHYYSAPIVIFSFPLACLCISAPLIITENTDGVSIVKKNQLMQRAQYIYGLLASTIKAIPPCMAIDQQLSFDLDVCYTLEIFKHKQSAVSTTDEVRWNRAAAMWDDSRDVGSVNHEFYDDNLLFNMEKFDDCYSIGSILLPYIRTLWFVMDQARGLADTIQITKAEFIEETCIVGEVEYKLGLRPALCTSRHHVTTFVEKLLELSVVKLRGEYLELSEKYGSDSSGLFQMISYISGYINPI